MRARFGLSGPTITYAGRLAPEKNIEVLLHAVAVLRDRGVDAELVIAGHGSHEPILRSLAAELADRPPVRFLGTLPQTNLAQLLRISDTFVIMSTSETQSMVLLQAMASGVPVVAADSGPCPNSSVPPTACSSTRRSGGAGPRAGGSAGRAGAAALTRLGRPARSAEKYSVETVTDEWEALYRSVLHGVQPNE